MKNHQIINAALKNKVLFSVCHALRYTAYTQKLREIIDSGEIREIVINQHLVPVGYFHQAHAFVRGHWRNEAKSSFMLLSISCHDIDWISYFLDESCLQVSSFGALSRNGKERQPTNTADRCCVYDCDNDVVGHQVVNMLFESKKTATFTMTAFNELGHRKTRIFGT